MGKKVLRTKLCDILGIEYPILSAGMGPTLIGEKTGAPVELVVAVSEAGGIGDGRGFAASLAMGCVGVWVGTRFLATDEGGALDVNKQRILDSTDEGTRVSTAYNGKTLRANYNKFHRLWDSSGLDPLPFPNQVLLSSALLWRFIEADKMDHVGAWQDRFRGSYTKSNLPNRSSMRWWKKPWISSQGEYPRTLLRNRVF